MTIHITPERACSYVSFESNVPVASYDDVIARVLRAFRPNKFVLTVFATPVSVVTSHHIIIRGVGRNRCSVVNIVLFKKKTV